MKFAEKIKLLAPKLNSRKGKIVGLVMLLVGSVSAATLTTLAWFSLATKESTIKMVTGDLNVEIRKVSAYKYVYPYYKGSNEFVDYDNTTDAVVKKYVLEDHTLKYNNANVDTISISSYDAVITLGTKVRGTFTNTLSDATYSNVYIPAAVAPATIYEPEFRYYLIGDDLFCGVNDSWNLTKGYAFASKANIVGNTEITLNNIVVSAGSSFRLLEALQYTENNQDVYAYNYYPLSSISDSEESATNTSPFRIIDNNRLLCLRSGIYNFTYSVNKLKIETRNSESGQGKDTSVIMNNSLDPTKINIDYSGGSVKKEDDSENQDGVDGVDYFSSIESYMPKAIYDQNTTLILDVELNFTNPNPVDASLQIERISLANSNSRSINSIFSLNGKYADKANNLIGVTKTAKNLLRASDFYNFYAKFTHSPYTNANTLWAGMHRMGDASSIKFSNGETFDDVLPCTLNPKEVGETTVVSAGGSINNSSNDSSASSNNASTDNIYHCYIAIEYDYEHCAYFLDENRLGKTYLLDHDFTFHFFGVQHKESQSQSSQESEESQEQYEKD